MKEIFIIEDNLSNKISYYHMLAFLVALPFERFYSELILISLLLHELIHLTKEKLRSFRTPIMLPALLFLLTLAGSLYTSHRGQAFAELEKELAFVLLPFIFAVTALDIPKYHLRLLKGFVIVCTATVVYLYMDAFLVIRYNHLPLNILLSTSFMNHNFSLPIDLHATYLSMYLLLSSTILIYLLNNPHNSTQRLLYFAGLAILLAGLIQLSSKAVLIAAIFIINIVLPFMLVKRDRRLKIILITVLVSVVLIVGLTRIDSIQTRYISGLKEDLAKLPVNINDVETRVARWQSAWELAKESLLFGHGSGSEIQILTQRYYQDRLYNSYLLQLNVHNQYLSFLLKTGLIGLFIYIYLLYAAGKRGVLAKDAVFCSFVIIVVTVSFSENLLNLNKGIFFFSFFYSFLMRKNYSADYKKLALVQS